MAVAVQRSEPPPSSSAVAEWPWWLATAAYFAAITLAHLQFSLWLVTPRDLPFGKPSLAGFVAPLMALCAILLAGVVFRQLRRTPWLWTFGGGWLFVLLCVWAIDRHLTFSTPEDFHYPQYAAVALLVARTLDPDRQRWIPGRVLFWTTLLGAIDESLQYLWICAAHAASYRCQSRDGGFVARSIRLPSRASLAIAPSQD